MENLKPLQLGGRDGPGSYLQDSAPYNRTKLEGPHFNSITETLIAGLGHFKFEEYCRSHTGV
jgi:hypothetical protein